MTEILGILFGIAVALLKAFDTLMNKKVMKDISPVHHSLYRILFVTPILLVAALFNWKLDLQKAVWVLLMYGGLEAFNILFHQMAIQKANVVHIELLSKSKIILALIVSFVLGIDALSGPAIAGIAIFTAGTVLVINFNIQRQQGAKTGNLGLVLEFLSVMCRVLKPFLVKQLLRSGSLSSETLAFISMPIAFVVLLGCYRPKLDFRQINVKDYGLQAIIVAASMIISGYAVQYANIVIVSALENISVFVVILFSVLVYKKKYSPIVILGFVLSVAGLVLSIL